MASFDFSSRYLLSVTFRSFWHAGFLLPFSCRYFVQTRLYTLWWCWIWGCEKVSASTQTQQLSRVAVERLLRLVHTKTNVHVKREWKTHRGFLFTSSPSDNFSTKQPFYAHVCRLVYLLTQQTRCHLVGPGSFSHSNDSAGRRHTWTPPLGWGMAEHRTTNTVYRKSLFIDVMCTIFAMTGTY